MKKEVKILIALDLDGTSVQYEPRLEMSPVLMEYIRSVAPMGVKWVMNSDRYFETMVDIAYQLEPDVQPAAILSCQRFIYLLNGENKYVSYERWNNKQTNCHRLLWDKIESCFNDWKKIIEKKFTILSSVINDQVFAYMVPDEETTGLRECMRDFISPWPEARVSGNQEWTFVLHSSFSKAGVLSKCADLFEVESRSIIAVGDGINDISMLDGSVANMTGCPSNAAREVIDTVTAAGGMLADSDAAAGTMQILKYYIEKKLS